VQGGVLMGLNAVSVLGVLIDNLTMDEVVDKIFEMIDEFRDNDLPGQLVTLNVDFLVNAHSWNAAHPRHPELLRILRHADIVTADGMPLIWMSRLMGIPLKERITGADLIPRLAEESAKRGRSIYLLGGREDSGKQAALILKNSFPELKIAGIEAPYVNTKGEALADSSYRDVRIIDNINRSGADILFIGFGNPKQEVWFKMNRKRLKTPISIGIGGAYSFISGSVKRAPEWIQKAGMEWLFRISQDPRRLWKRYLVGLFKFSYMAMPVILYYRYRMFRDRIFQKKQEEAKDGSLTYTAITGDTILIKLPGRFIHKSINQIHDKINSPGKTFSQVVFDLSDTFFIDPYGLGFLMTLLRNGDKDKHSIYLTGLNKSIIRIFKINRLWDILKEISFKNINDILTAIKIDTSRTPLHILSESSHKSFRIELSGRLDEDSISGLDTPSIIKGIGDRECFLSLHKLEFIDSSGLAFLLKIRNHLAGHNRIPILSGLSANIIQMLSIAGLANLFQIVPDSKN
jgi:N-acetylglucosaminyldiphosphoundecaprenol N-acetyl-beta-D-mannosaminyltransferase